ncbi:MAG: TonB-dependent receptor [Tannerellaceae bacterium]|jgi:TonB-linked SusC/RagA family outer membrane protein|nr:TonB-dependent receptor [Tannerellaceae bacterium]
MIVLGLISMGNIYVKADISQQKPFTVAGVVKDNTGEPLVGVSVIVSGSTVGTATDMDGKYLINVPPDGSLTISYVGFKQMVVPVRSRTEIDVILEEDTRQIGEVLVVGYGTQRKVTLTGAVSAVKGSEIVATKNENVQNMLTGKIAGVRVTQKTAEPGAFNNDFDIRGMGAPLIVIDGVPRTTGDLQRMDPNDIEDLSILKDASAAIYGVRAANGVALVTTKKGRLNTPAEITYSGSYTWQVPSGLPATLNAIDFMTLTNELSMHNINNTIFPVWSWSEEDIEAYRNGAKTSVDWYNIIFSQTAPQTQHNVTVTGGNAATSYHVGLGYFYQDGFFKGDDLSYDKYNVRANISTKVTKGLTFDLNMSGIMETQNNQWYDTWDIFKRFWRTGPHSPVYADSEETMLYYGLIEGDNPLAWIDGDVSGYKKFDRKWIGTSAGLKWDIPAVKGLSLKGLLDYDYYNSDETRYRKSYNEYRYNEVSNTYQTWTINSPNTIQRQFYSQSQLLTQLMIDYSRTFDKHEVKGTLVWETQQRKGDNFYAKRELPLPLDHLFAGVSANQEANMDAGSGALYEKTNLALAGKVNYEFAQKYLVTGMFRYDGSSMFGPGHQWGFFPGGSVGWRISEESFFKNSPLSFVQQLKLRTSYGILGDDGASSYQFVSGYNYPTASNRRMFNAGYVFGGSYTASADNKGITNSAITWYRSKSFDIGVDMDAWNGLFGFTFDYFNRTRDGLLTTRNGSIPTIVGAGLPQENINSDRHFGMELELSHRNTIEDLTYRVRTIGAVTRRKTLYVERAPNGSSWANWKNNSNDRLTGIYWGYQGDGHFTSWEDIWNSPYKISRSTIIGDYAFEDWNGDGMIDSNDVHPVQYDASPWVNYSFIFEGTYKGFDLNVLFQGAALSSLTYGEKFAGVSGGNNNTLAQFLDRWRPADPAADPYDPKTEWIKGYYAYSGTNLTANSTFNTENSAYFRLKSLELGYTFSKLKTFRNVRLYVNGYNLFTITKVRDVDPEHPEDSYGYMYPLNKSYSVGVNVKF